MRMIARIQAVIVLLTLVACGGKESDSGMADMTPEEHARMLAGGNQGAADTSGEVLRQPVHLTAGQERALGVVYMTVGRSDLTKVVRTVGTIQPAEPRIKDVTPKIDGYVEELLVSTTGETVHRGQPLLSIYSPSLVAAQEEFLTASRLVRKVDSSATEAWQAAQLTLQSARRRLVNWDITEEQIDRLGRSGEVTKTLTLVSPVDGVVLSKDVLAGQRVISGQRLYQVADLREVWVEGEVFEQDLSLVHEGMQAHVEVAARPGEHLMGRVSFVYPTVDPVSRTNRVRLTIANAKGALKPGMFATMYLDASVGHQVIALPRAAVVVTGTRNIVFVRDSLGMLVPREVVLGGRTEDEVEVRSGLSVGETVVSSANFLIDAESRLASSGGAMPGMAGMQHGAAPERSPAADTGRRAMSTMSGMQDHDHD